MYCTDHTTSPLCTIDGVSRAPVLLQDVIVILQVLMLSAFCRGVI